jgi:GT2 family glycosyltransferase
MENNTNHINIIILTPGHSLMGSYVRSLLDTQDELTKRGITWAWSNEYSSHVADSREITLSGTRVNDPSESRPFAGIVTYDKLMWIDSDISWKPEDVIKLYESDKGIISGAYLLSGGEVVAYPKMFGEPYQYKDVVEMTEPIKVSTTGFGFICIKQGIFESMTRPWFQSVPATATYKDKEYTFPIMGEDMSWCYRATSLGYEVWFDPTVKVTHHKTIELNWKGITK